MCARHVLRFGATQSAARDGGTIQARLEVAVQNNSATKLTYDDYLRFPDDGLRHEIIEGEHYVTASPVTQQRILLKLSFAAKLSRDTSDRRDLLRTV